MCNCKPMSSCLCKTGISACTVTYRRKRHFYEKTHKQEEATLFKLSLFINIVKDQRFIRSENRLRLKFCNRLP